MQNSFYVVLNGRKTGIFNDWESCREQVHKFKNAIYQKALTFEEARVIFDARGCTRPQGTKSYSNGKPSVKKLEQVCKSRAVLLAKGSCAGNPGEITANVIDLRKSQEYQKKFGNGTSNLAESIAIYRALRIRSMNGVGYPIYSDSSVAINRIKGRKINGQNDFTYSPHLVEYIQEANEWLKNSDLSNVFHASEYGPDGMLPQSILTDKN
jgi:ribonuclease HI